MRRAFGLLGLALGALACRSPSEPSNDLSKTYPTYAERVLAVSGGRAFTEVSGGFASVRGGRLAARIEARRIDLRAGEARIGVVEEEITGGARRDGEAIALSRRDGGTAYWSARDGGFEEWLALGPGVAVKDNVVARYRVEGAVLRQRGDRVDVLGPRGNAVVTVTASEAVTASGRSLVPRLVARGRTIELYADAGGEAALVDPTWVGAASMTAARTGHTVDRLPDGRVIACGGDGATGVLDTCDLYDPEADHWTQTSAMPTPRVDHASTVLPNGHVVLSGGFSLNNQTGNIEEYDPSNDSWTSRGAIQYEAVDSLTATLLLDGRILFTGGNGGFSGSVASAGTIDTSSWQWADLQGMANPRAGHTATLLPTGAVVLLGGSDSTGSVVAPTSPSTSKPAPPVYGAASDIEVFDPTTNQFEVYGSLDGDRRDHSAVLLPNNEILVVGGMDYFSTQPYASGEIVETINFTSSLLPSQLSAPHFGNVAALLEDGRVLVTADGVADLYDPVAESFVPTTSPTENVQYPVGVTTSKGVVVAGGVVAGSPVPDVAIFRAALAPGIVCGGDDDCASNACSDGVCCDKACGLDGCAVCTKAKGATADGTCTALADDTECDDGLSCTTGDACKKGVCAGALSCDVPVCQQAVGCDPMGDCTFSALPDGAPCDGGSCFAGACIGDPDAGALTVTGSDASASGGDQATGGGGAPGAGGAASAAGENDSSGGCSVVPGRSDERFSAVAALALALAIASGRKRRARL